MREKARVEGLRGWEITCNAIPSDMTFANPTGDRKNFTRTLNAVIVAEFFPFIFPSLLRKLKDKNFALIQRFSFLISFVEFSWIYFSIVIHIFM